MKEDLKTARGVYRNLEDSDITFTINKYCFKFSSQAKLKKYINQMNDNMYRFGKKIDDLRELTGLALSGPELDRLHLNMYVKTYDEMEKK